MIFNRRPDNKEVPTLRGVNPVWDSLLSLRDNILVSYGIKIGVVMMVLCLLPLLFENKLLSGFLFFAGLLIVYESNEKVNAQNSIKNLEMKNEVLSKALQHSENEREKCSVTLNVVLNSFLNGIANRLNLSGNERINLFAVITDDQYLIVGRYTENTHLSGINSTSETVFKPFLDVAYKSANGNLIIDHLPDFEGNHGEYLDTLRNKCGVFFPKNLNSKKLRMKPRNLCVQVIMDHGKRIGLVVFESKDCGVFNDKIIQDLLLEQRPILAKFIHHGKTYNS